MLETLHPENILFLDIETVPQYSSFEEVPEHFRELWEKKMVYSVRDNETAADLYRRAGIYAEFGKVICISSGIFTHDGKLRIHSCYGHDEGALLREFAALLERFCADPRRQLCAHNGKEFDFPFLARRMTVHGMKLPHILDTPGKKPWEVNHLDTMELWKFGDYKSFTSLALLAAVFGIPTPKDDIDGSRVWEVYWREKNLERIVTYCQKDVLTVAQIFRRFRGEALISSEEVEIV